MNLSKYVWFDGRYVIAEKAKVPITTHAIHYGTSVFEGIRAYWNGKNLHIFRLKEHLERFRRSGKFYDIELRFSDKDMHNAIIGICKKNKLKSSCYIRPFYFIGNYGISLNVTKKTPTNAAIFVFPFGDLFDKNGISIKISSWRKFSDNSTPPQAKMGGNYLNSIIATQEAKKFGADEAILLDHDGDISEAPGENIFIVRDGHILTPTLSSSILEGITRDTVINMAINSHIEVIEHNIARSELFLADEIFLTGTAAEITPVTSVDGIKIGDGKPGIVTKSMIKGYNNIVMNKDSKYSDWLTAVY